ncbi:hypothetical protein PIB30_081330 [Stylosanthes scabra]|uniref:Uncharacterized protein n=1 Tax=Stylosanthes scabra TaxID=79078 RepID=A0ABU6TSB2_9FABA|nr:hypothetical protein [Stylosanthes scabra]
MAVRTELIMIISTPKIRPLPSYTLVYKGPCHLQVWGGLMSETTIWTFYDGTLPTSRILLDSAANGSLRTKTPDEALELIELNLEKHEASASRTLIICGICGGPHENLNCMSIQDDQFSAIQVNYVNNQPRPPYNDPHSNTYNPGWRNHPNFSWGGNQGQQRQYNNQNPQILKDNLHSLQLNLLKSNRIILKML